MTEASRVRVIVVLPADPERMAIGGIASFVRGFVKFAPPDFEVWFAGISDTRPVGTWHDVTLEGRPVRFLPVARGRAERRSRMPIALAFVLGLVRHRRALPLTRSVLSFHRPATDLPFLLDRSRRWRVVHLSVDDLTTGGGESRWRRFPRLLGRMERASFGRMDRIYVVNERVAADYRYRHPHLAGRFVFLPNWADDTIFRPPADEERARARSAITDELGLSDPGVLALYAGRLEGQKDPELLAETVVELRARGADIQLLIAGEGSREGQVRTIFAHAGATDAVRFLGTRPRHDVARLMHAADLLLISSRYETGPTIGFESLACGVPIATTAVGEVARLVRDHGAGCVSAGHTAPALADAVEWIIGQPVASLRRAAVDAVQPFLARRVLETVYADTRALAAPGAAAG